MSSNSGRAAKIFVATGCLYDVEVHRTGIFEQTTWAHLAMMFRCDAPDAHFV